MEWDKLINSLAIVALAGSSVPFFGGFTMLAGLGGILALVSLVLVFWNPFKK